MISIDVTMSALIGAFVGGFVPQFLIGIREQMNFWNENLSKAYELLQQAEIDTKESLRIDRGNEPEDGIY